MSRKILISLGSLSVLGAAACALTFFDFNLAETIKREEENKEFALYEQDNQETSKTPPEEDSPVQGPVPKAQEELEETEETIQSLSQDVEEEEEEQVVAVVESPQPTPVPEPTLSPSEEKSENAATSINETVTVDNQAPEPPANLKNELPEEPKKPDPLPPTEEPKVSVPVPTKPKVPEVPQKPTAPDTTQNKTTSPEKFDSKGKTSSKSTPSKSGQKQTVKDLWSKEKKNIKASPTQGIGSTNLIRDYSLRLVNNCTSGTIWILDYELPTETEYPTKFFFGTSARVAASIKFDSNKNTYKQTLPTSNKCQSDESQIVGETDINYGGADHFRTYLWKPNEQGFLDIRNDNNDVTKWPKDQTHKPPYFHYKTKDIELAYVATDFAGESKNKKWENNNYKSDSYMADFAVIEIDFQDSVFAERMTRGFHSKYGNKGAIDLFSPPLLKGKNNHALYDSNMDIYVAGYSKNGLRGRSSGSFNLDDHQASKLTYSKDHHMIKDDNDEGEIIGHADASHSTEPISEYGENRYPRGLEIVIEYDALEEGSWGSLVTDSDGKAIGVKSKYNTKDKISSITAFRSKEIKHKGKVIIPEYDLIAGVSSNPQGKSYKDSILKANKQTYLSKKQGWSNKK